MVGEKTPPGSSLSIMAGLTYAQHLPTPFITTFILIHLTAPAVASIGGMNAASQVMLLGREYYHGVPQEDLLVFTPITLHVAASLAKRLAKMVGALRRTRVGDIKEKSAKDYRIISPANALQLTGYPLLLLLSPHITTHRVHPSTPSPPISSISPSEFDFSFVNFGLKNWPVRSWIMYSVLVGAGVMHVTYGAPIVWRTILRLLKKVGIVRSGSTWKTSPKASLVGIGIILLGVFRISQEDVFLTRLASTRMMASYQLSDLYK
ncbi:hypothetical protein FS749_011048 [Ceratobasidium sp. UAMH 11750]|nr:hypothetical protein FS749_011048 [Ceratobasidium sp. UAMH 11750]